MRRTTLPLRQTTNGLATRSSQMTLGRLGRTCWILGSHTVVQLNVGLVLCFALISKRRNGDTYLLTASAHGNAVGWHGNVRNY